MASLIYFFVFSGFVFAVAQSVTTEILNEWDVERSSVNPLSVTDEAHYFRDGSTESPLLRSERRNNCPAGEHFTRCDANCEITCDNYKKPIPCPRLCIWGCVCNLGLVRGPDKKCINPKECLTKPRSEVLRNFSTDADARSAETENPQNSWEENPSALPSNLWPTSLICRKNEQLDPCPSSCPDDCNNFRNKDRKCLRICIPSCVCKSGFVRSHDGKCIKPHECHKEKNFCPRGEEYSPCHSHCEGNCVKGEENKNKCHGGGILCISGCTCKAGLVRGPEGTCIYNTECPTIPPKDPPTKVCPENEVYDKCTAACQRNCSNVESALPCPRMCIPGCICKESMIRGKYGKCVEADECPKDDYSSDDEYDISEVVTKIPSVSETENSQFEEIPPIPRSEPSHKCPPRHRWVVCGGHCQRNCSNKDDKNFRCRPVCIPGCICEEGFVKGPDGKCIEKDKCPKTSESESDRYATLNPPPYTDDDYHTPESVTRNPSISETENSQFEEITPTSYANQFPFPIAIICGKDEIRERCPSTCPDNCNNYKDTKRKCGKVCMPACICKKGLVRGPKGKCIKPTECSNDQKDTCRKDEMFSRCKGKCEKNCSNWAFELKCPKACVSGCVCRPGRIRGPDGKCIIWSECPRGSYRYPGATSTETSPTMKSTENNRLNISDNAGCPNDNECTLSCRNYGHRYGHCTGRNNLVCSCYIENHENVEYD